MRIRLSAINGYLDTTEFTYCVNDKIIFQLDTPLNGDFLLNLNGKTYRFDSYKSLEIPSSDFLAENILAVSLENKKWNCGKLFATAIDTELGEMLTIEKKYQQDITRLVDLYNGLKSTYDKVNNLSGEVEYLRKQIDELKNGTELFKEN